jgi:hypothetical protein
MCIEIHYVYKKRGCLATSGTHACFAAHFANQDVGFDRSCLDYEFVVHKAMTENMYCLRHMEEAVGIGTWFKR